MVRVFITDLITKLVAFLDCNFDLGCSVFHCPKASKLHFNAHLRRSFLFIYYEGCNIRHTPELLQPCKLSPYVD